MHHDRGNVHHLPFASPHITGSRGHCSMCAVDEVFAITGGKRITKAISGPIRTVWI